MPQWRKRRRTHTTAAATALCAGVLLANPAPAQFIQQGAKLVASDYAGTAQQGYAVALSADGNTALVGGPGNFSGGANDMGAAWIYTRSNGVWSQSAKLAGSGAVGAARQGYAVALSSDGNTALIGGPADNNNVGAAWVFVRINGTWSQQDKLVGSGVAGQPQQGLSVALSADGNTALIGAPFDGNNLGGAWVFTRGNGLWSQQGGELVGTGFTNNGLVLQGYSVGLSADGNTALLGAPYDNSGVGGVWVFGRSNGVWSQSGGELVGNGAIGAAYQGWSVALPGDGFFYIWGGPFDNTSSGAVWIEAIFGNAKFVGRGATGAPEQGSAVAFSDSFTAVVGGPLDNAGNGAAYVMTLAGGLFVPYGAKLVGAGAATTANQGASVAISRDGNTIIVGGPSDHGAIGAAWVFTRQATATHDTNGDGISEIAWRQANGSTALWLMYGAGVTQSGDLGSVPSSWQIVGQRDFNGDRAYDWLWRDSSTGNVAIWLLSGLQIQQSGVLGTIGLNWSVAGTSDFNADGKGDILWRDTQSGTVAIWLMNGLSIAQSASLGVVTGNWSIAVTDGKGEIFWRDINSGTVAIWSVSCSSGCGISQSANLGSVAGNWMIAGVGDFDGNGSTDILWRDGQTGTAAIWLMNGLQVQQTGTLGVVPGNWSIAVTGDFDGDGRSDILWRDTAAGTVAIWFMNGLSISSTATVATITTDWAIQGANAD